MILFSVILPTRNRPALFQAALESVMRQTCTSVEIIVVLDGPSAENRPAYDAIAAAASDRARFLWIDHWSRGHGHAHALNFGAAKAQGAYLCFLDDDDCWTDPHHLEHARVVIESSRQPVDAYFANLAAFARNVRQPGPIWIEDVEDDLRAHGKEADANGAYDVGVEELLRSVGFCHLNTLIVRRGLFEEIGGMDPCIWYEEDRDLYFRIIDAAKLIKYSPAVVARHNVPDAAAATSLSTALAPMRKWLYRLQVLNKAALFSRHKAIRAYATLHSTYTHKKIAMALVHNRRYREAAVVARQALLLGPTVRWMAYCAWIEVRAVLSRQSNGGPQADTPSPSLDRREPNP